MHIRATLVYFQFAIFVLKFSLTGSRAGATGAGRAQGSLNWWSGHRQAERALNLGMYSAYYDLSGYRSPAGAVTVRASDIV
ncbi:hypothetical protein J2Y68_002288 [Paenarthrobacter nitroguajacolicus]|nr:hypothetical protein [Paenarthrobacter nitroguajacolicus]